MAENRWVTGVFSPQSMEFYGALQDGSSVAPARPLAPMEPRGPTATSGGRSIFRRAMFTGNPAMWAYVYIYIYNIYLETHIAILFLSKRIFSSFFVDYGFFCQIRYFSNLRVRFFPTTCWKNMGLLRVTASTLIKYKTKYAYGHFLEHYGVYPA